ncbi:MAG: hypothetical protein JW768_06035, partial [Chitinispirillaceae bacterium]|nr:hypothetical protein [Chitinispirillaceae bacterium]
MPQSPRMVLSNAGASFITRRFFMRINHNISSMVTQGSLFKVNRDMSKSLERLSTGLRINRASDDAAGLSVS